METWHSHALYMHRYFKSMAPSMPFYLLSSKYSSMAAVCTEKLLKGFQRDCTQGRDHTETSALHPGLLSRGINLLLPTVPCPRLGHIAVLREGQGRQLGLAASSVPVPTLAPCPQRCRCPGLGAGALFPDWPGCTSPLTRCGSLFLFSAVI